jgi:hypothetical protein
MNYNNILYSLCIRNNSNLIKRIFEGYNQNTDEIDVLFSDYQLFKIAISNNNYEICEALLSFFENKQNSTEEQKEKLKEVLEEITSFSDVSKEMKVVIKNYVPYEEDSREECFDEVDNANFQNWLNSVQSNDFKQDDFFDKETVISGDLKDNAINAEFS